jgi:hypothetical protein
MIARLLGAVDNLLGRGEAAITVPPLDGALRPNSLLDDATSRYSLEGVDCLAVQSGDLLATSGRTVHTLATGGVWRSAFEAPTEIACMASLGDDGLALGLIDGRIVVSGGPHDRREYRLGRDAACITAIAAAEDALVVTNGSASNAADAWQRDLLQGNASGSVWRIELESGRAECLADGLAYPAGLAVDGAGLVVSEAWRHRLVRIDPDGDARTETIYGDLPGYPGRMTARPGGWWLALFAPRSQLVEFILREPTYRRRMIDEVPPACWIAPKLRSGRSFYEPMQGGGVKHLGLLKPWAPTMSAGLCVRLDTSFQPVTSLQSRADGATHGVTSVVETGDSVFVAARGDGVVVEVSNAMTSVEP